MEIELDQDDIPDWHKSDEANWDEDNSDDFMAESLKEAEAEVKSNKGEGMSLAQQIKTLEEQSTVKESGDTHDRAVSKAAAAMTSEALGTRSQVSFDGNDIKLAVNAEDEEAFQSERDRKTAIKGALSDIESELHPDKADEPKE